MTEENSEKVVCNHPRVEIGAWGQRLYGCIQCNQWMNIDGEWLRLPKADIAVSWRRFASREVDQQTSKHN
jgi:hypothetical protein